MIFLTILVATIIALYYYTTRNYGYWKERGIKHDKPLPLFGNSIETYFMRKGWVQCGNEMYRKYPNEKVVGYYRLSQPELIIREPELVKRILVTDFSHFYPRGANYKCPKVEPLLKNLFFADGDLWKLLRQRITPAFTSGKLKAMFPLICERAERLQSIVESGTRDSKTLDARDLMARFTTDFIGAIGFGLDADSLNNEDSAFRKLGFKIFNQTISLFVIDTLKQMFPVAAQNLKATYTYEKELMELVYEILRQRNYKPCGRNDFIDLLLECRQKGTIVSESIEKVKADGSPEIATLEMDDALLAAQVFVFFAAGFETSSSATSFTLHQLAFNPEVQKRVQEDIDRVLTKYDNKLCYDAIKEMTYLECAFKEGMRMFPSLGYLQRECARQYTIPDLNVTIDPGVSILIPIEALHNDPKYFEEPEEFRPERFLADNFDVQKNKFVYLPFGEGPRGCIGARLGLMQSLAGLAAVLSKFSVEPAPTTKRKITVNPASNVVQTIMGGLPLLFKTRKV